MRKCNKCKRTWVSQSPKCIYCNSEDIIWDYKESEQEVNMEKEFKVVENADVINRMYNQKDGTFGVKDDTESEVEDKE